RGGEAGHGAPHEGGDGQEQKAVPDLFARGREPGHAGPTGEDGIGHEPHRCSSRASRSGRSVSEKWRRAMAALWSSSSWSGAATKAARGPGSEGENQRNPKAASSRATG